MIVRFSKKYGKKTMLVIASVIFTVVFAFIYFGDKLAALVPGHELYQGLFMGVVVAFPFAAINLLPLVCFLFCNERGVPSFITAHRKDHG